MSSVNCQPVRKRPSSRPADGLMRLPQLLGMLFMLALAGRGVVVGAADPTHKPTEVNLRLCSNAYLNSLVPRSLCLNLR